MSPLVTSRRGSRIIIFWLFAGLVVLLDQATKAAVRYVAPSTGFMRVLIPGLIDLVHVENTGAAFSIGEGAGPLFALLALVVACAAYVFVCTQEPPLPLTASIACVVGGGLGNMFDRLMHGSVTDFIATSFIDFPVFNVADIAVTCGIFLSFVLYLMWEGRASEEAGR